MSERPDWEAIRREYEAGGISLQKLADRHGVSKSYLIERRDRGNWTRPTDRPTDQNNRSVGDSNLRVLRSELPSPPSTLRGANLIVEDLVEILEEQRKKKSKLEIVDYLKITNALFQCNRIIVNAPPEEEEEGQKDFSDFNEDELRQYAEFEERARKRA